MRRERPHPGAQLDLFDTADGWRHQVIATDTPSAGNSSRTWRSATAPTPASRTASAAAKTPAAAEFPSRGFAINKAWLELALTAGDLLTWTQALLPGRRTRPRRTRRLRYRLLHVAARLTRTARRT